MQLNVNPFSLIESPQSISLTVSLGIPHFPRWAPTPNPTKYCLLFVKMLNRFHIQMIIRDHDFIYSRNFTQTKRWRIHALSCKYFNWEGTFRKHGIKKTLYPSISMRTLTWPNQTARILGATISLYKGLTNGKGAWGVLFWSPNKSLMLTHIS